MNGIDKIAARIETDAVADAARMAEEAQAQCGVIRAGGETRAQESYWQRVREGVKSAEDRVQRLAKAADMEARKSILACKQQLVAEAFDMAEAKLRALTGDGYIEFLAALAARAAVSGREELVLSAADRAACGTKVVKRANALLGEAGRTAALTLGTQEGSFEGGLIVREGDVSVNCTVEALMAEARQSMASEVAAALLS